MALPEVREEFPKDLHSASDVWVLDGSVLVRNDRPFLDLREVRRIERRRVDLGGRQTSRIRLVLLSGHEDITFDRRSRVSEVTAFQSLENAILRRYCDIYPDVGVIRERRFDNAIFVPLVLALVAAVLIIGWGNSVIQDNQFRAGLGLGLALFGVVVGLAEYLPWRLHRFDIPAAEFLRERF